MARCALVTFLVFLLNCGGKAVIDSVRGDGGTCRPMPVATEQTTTCEPPVLSSNVCHIVQCDPVGNRYELDCTLAVGCVCRYNGEVFCSGEGDWANVCPNSIPAIACPGFPFVDFGWPR